MFFFNNSSCCCNHRPQCVQCRPCCKLDCAHNEREHERPCCKCDCCRQPERRPKNQCCECRCKCCCKCCRMNDEHMFGFDGEYGDNEL